MYKDLSLKEKSELFKLMVSNGITDINEIERIYNSYQDGGNKISADNLPESQQYAVTTPDGQRKVFNSKQEASDYITANTPKGYSLYDITNYGTNIDKGQTAILNRNTEREIEKATKQEELAKARLATIQQNKEASKEMLSYMPVIGDGMDLYQLGKDVYNGNYLNAGIGLGLLALPNVIEKPIKYVGKGIKKLIGKSKNKLDLHLDENTPDYIWDEEYFKAIEQNNKKRIQEIVDKRYKTKVKNIENINIDQQGNPIVYYHGSEYGGHNIFDSSIFNATIGGASARGEKGNFLTTDLPSAERYAGRSRYNSREVKDYTEPNNFKEKILSTFNLYVPEYIHPVDRISEDLKPNLKHLTDTREKSILDRIDYSLPRELRPKETVYPLYINPTSSKIVDFEGNPWSKYPGDLPNKFSVETKTRKTEIDPTNLERGVWDENIKDFKSEQEAIEYFNSLKEDYGPYFDGDLNALKTKPFDFNGTRRITMYTSKPKFNSATLIETPTPHTTNGVIQDSFRNNYDTVLMKNVIDSNGGYDGVGYAIDDLVVRYPNQIKLASPITYDDSSKIIPISKRFDFNNPDIRYSWLLPTIGVGTGLSLMNNENNQYKYGGPTNKFDEGGYSKISSFEDGKSINNISKLSYIKDLLHAAKDNFTLDLDTQKERFYKHFNPYDSYTDDNIKRAFELFIGGPEFAKKEFYKRQETKPFKDNFIEGAGDPPNDAIWASYLGIPENKRQFKGKNKYNLEYSKYTPTKGAEYNKYYKIPDLNDFEIEALIREGQKLKIGENALTKVLFLSNMGTSTIGKGIDNKGEYISYYDLWDINPLHGDNAYNIYAKIPLVNKIFYNKGKDIFRGITNPIPFYDRIYLDDYYNVNSAPPKGDYYGGYLPEIEVSNWGSYYKNGGILNKYDDGGNKQTTTLEKPSFFEGDTWKPWYWGTPEYNTPTLKDAIFNAYDDGLLDQDIMWNNKAYKARLTPKEATEWRNSRNISFGNKKTKPNSVSNPRERMLNTYTPILHDNNMYYYDTYSRNFYKDNKGTDVIEDPNNDLLYAYYNQYVSPLGKSNNYEDMVKFYIQQMRNTQAQRRKFIIDQDLSKDFMKDAVTITTGKSGTSRLGYSKELIRNIYENLPEYNPNDVLPMDIYTALAIPYVESDFGHRVNSHSDWMGTRGNLIPIFNNDGYELPDDTFYGDLSYGIHTYFNKHAKYNKKTDRRELEGLSRVEFLNKYLTHREDDLFDIELLYNKDMLNHVGESLKKNMGYNKFKKNVLKDKENPNFYKVAFDKARIGKYNPGKEEVYNNEVLKTAAALRKDPELNKTLREMGIIK